MWYATLLANCSNLTIFINLQSSETKIDLSFPRFVLQSYESDPTIPTTKEYCTDALASGKGKCIRCLRQVEQGALRVGFSTYSAGRTISRWYHAECFGAYPPSGVNADNITFGSNIARHNPALEPRLRGLFVQRQAAPPATTGAALQGMRAYNEGLKAQGVSVMAAIGYSKKMWVDPLYDKSLYNK